MLFHLDKVIRDAQVHADAKHVCNMELLIAAKIESTSCLTTGNWLNKLHVILRRMFSKAFNAMGHNNSDLKARLRIII